MKKYLIGCVLLSLMIIFPTSVLAKVIIEEQTYGKNGEYGSLYGSDISDENNETSKWLTYQIGERGIRIINEEQQEIVKIDKYGGIYIKGDVYLNDSNTPVDKTKSKNFSIGFLYLLIVCNFILLLFTRYKLKKS